jgi:MFS family permease
VAFGIYETSLPLWLDSLGISFMSMGVIFGLSQLGILVVRYVAGARSDEHGRKHVFVASLLVSSAAFFSLPAFSRAVPIATVKMVRDAAGVVRDIMRSITVYEKAGKRFIRWIGGAVGVDYFFMALGALATGWIITRLGFRWTFWAAGALGLLSAFAMWRWFDEKRVPSRARPGSRGGNRLLASLREMASFDLPRDLWLLAGSGFVFNIGLTASHSFYLLLFWRDKFGATIPEMSVIQTFHRFMLGLPTIFAGRLVDRPAFRRHYKTIYIGALILQGLSIGGTTFIPWLVPAAVVFMVHDLVGASFWVPVQAHFIQGFARPAFRGRDVALVGGLSSLGSIFGPILAGWLVGGLHWKDGPYLASAAITVVAALMILALRDPATASPREARRS